jgi:hypothetical protein
MPHTQVKPYKWLACPGVSQTLVVCYKGVSRVLKSETMIETFGDPAYATRRALAALSGS